MCDGFSTFGWVIGGGGYVRSMARGLRSCLPDGVFHVTTRGVNGCAIYLDDSDRWAFLGLLAECVERNDWNVHVYCLMTTHYHLVVEATQEELSLGMQRLNGVHALRFNRRHRRHGHLFGDRFASWVIEGEDYFAATCRYVLLNPVRAGLCRRPEEWPWSLQATAR
jgi:REP-associated tyrosine transposase